MSEKCAIFVDKETYLALLKMVEECNKYYKDEKTTVSDIANDVLFDYVKNY